MRPGTATGRPSRPWSRAGSGRLYAIAYRILRDADLANDALQEALVRIWDDLPTLRDPDRYDPWTYRITCRACYRSSPSASGARP